MRGRPRADQACLGHGLRQAARHRLAHSSAGCGDLDGPVLGDYADEPRLGLLTLVEARDVARRLQALADGTAEVMSRDVV
ncbi:hypothetical protein ACFYMW_39445 [Streptomyces sp. NPDC006692]|uniref:hypothetical protein n=1 Tax=unclassified Streptomyces TaxID=2593676 RepID=UPI0036A15F68